MVAADVLRDQRDASDEDTGEQDQQRKDPRPVSVHAGGECKHAHDLVQLHVQDHRQHQDKAGCEREPAEVPLDQGLMLGPNSANSPATRRTAPPRDH